jgi:Family of unknown function (DUF6812)
MKKADKQYSEAFLVNHSTKGDSKSGAPEEADVLKQPRRQEKVKIRLVDNLVIEGSLHMKKNFRLSDAMNSANVEFLPLSNARILHNGQILEELKFIAVNRSQVKYISSSDIKDDKKDK